MRQDNQKEGSMTTREIVQDLRLNYSINNRILKEHKIHPYHLVLHQELIDELIIEIG